MTANLAFTSIYVSIAKNPIYAIFFDNQLPCSFSLSSHGLAPCDSPRYCNKPKRYGNVLYVISCRILLVMPTKHSIRLLLCSKTLVYIEQSHDRNTAIRKPACTSTLVSKRKQIFQSILFWMLWVRVCDPI